MEKMSTAMDELLTFLAAAPADGRWQSFSNSQSWHIQPINGGANNILYRATSSEIDLAVKFTIRDGRQRANREYQALLALQEARLDIAPRPILLDEVSFAQPVVVQSWVEGLVTAVLPQTDTEWELLIAHFAAIHSVTPDRVTASIPPAYINFSNVTNGLQLVQAEINRVPQSYRPAALMDLFLRLEKVDALDTAADTISPLVLCRVDPNSLNFIRRPGTWYSVDWENSGWGDPAYEIADLITHPAYKMVSWQRWQWVIEQYGQMTGDETAISRIYAYYPLMLVWWVARLTRYLYEVPRGLDERLASRPADWQRQIEDNFRWYVDWAAKVLSTPKQKPDEYSPGR